MTKLTKLNRDRLLSRVSTGKRVRKMKTDLGYVGSVEELGQIEVLRKRLLKHVEACPEELGAEEMRSEAAFQSKVLQCVRECGWRYYHTHNSRRSPGGFPDLVIIDRYGLERMIIAELKSSTGKLKDTQKLWIKELKASPDDLRVFVWRPSHWAAIRNLLHRDMASEVAPH